MRMSYYRSIICDKETILIAIRINKETKQTLLLLFQLNNFVSIALNNLHAFILTSQLSNIEITKYLINIIQKLMRYFRILI